MTNVIKTIRNGHVLQITINRADKGNAFNWEVIRGIGLAYTELDEDPELRCAVVNSTGKLFSAGLDLMDMGPRMANNTIEDEGLVNPFRLAGANIALRECSKPIIVAIHGKCFTAGIELALAADIVLCSDDATFAQAEVRRGIFPLGGATFRMPAAFGWGNAMRWLLTGDQFDADEALRIGLVQQITPRVELLSKAVEVANRIASAAPLGVQAVLRNARIARDEGNHAASLALNPEFQNLFGTNDASEGLTSILEKREAVFSGN